MKKNDQMDSRELINLLEEPPLDDPDNGQSYLSPDTTVVNTLDLANLIKSTLGEHVYEAFAEFIMFGTEIDPVIKLQIKIFLSSRQDYISQEILQGLGDAK